MTLIWSVACSVHKQEKENIKNFLEKCHEKVKIMNPDGQEYADNFSRFIIIGGGISGLSAANTLVQRGIKDFK